MVELTPDQCTQVAGGSLYAGAGNRTDDTSSTDRSGFAGAGNRSDDSSADGSGYIGAGN
jgi:hypothetical protein